MKKTSKEETNLARAIPTADALMTIFGYKRKAVIQGNVVKPDFEKESKQNQEIET